MLMHTNLMLYKHAVYSLHTVGVQSNQDSAGGKNFTVLFQQ